MEIMINESEDYDWWFRWLWLMIQRIMI